MLVMLVHMATCRSVLMLHLWLVHGVALLDARPVG